MNKNIRRIDVSIIIVNYNTSKLVIDSIESIKKHSVDISYEVIIVDNNSTDGVDLLEFQTKQYSSVIILKLDSNIGFGLANNEGAKIASGHNLFFLNPDTLLLNNAIKILSDELDNNQDYGACGGNLLNENLEPTRSFRRQFPDILWILEYTFFFHIPELIRYGNNRFFNHLNKKINVAYIVGADLMMKKELFDEIGGFNPAFFMYYEEIELCFRVKEKGFKVVSIPDASIQHLEGKSTKNMKFKSTQHFFSSRAYFSLTHSKINIFFVKIIKLVLITSRLLLFSILYKKSNIAFWRVQLYLFFKRQS